MGRILDLATRSLRRVRETVSADGLSGVGTVVTTAPRTLVSRSKGRLVRSGSRFYSRAVTNPGTPVWHRDWDVLVILDACRVDLMREVGPEYTFVGSDDDVGSMWSVGGKSSDWLRRTFVEEYRHDVEETAYVTGNPFTATADGSDAVLSEAERFGRDVSDNIDSTGRPNVAVLPKVLDEVWKYAWDDDLSTIPPRPMTDRAIATWRRADVDRMIVHYMQPHGPFIGYPELGEYGDPDDFGRGFGTLWREAGRSIPLEDIWTAYRDNLRHVLDDVELLLDSVDAETVAISADHGNAIGEWGVYGHPPDVLLPCIRKVPWVVTSGSDSRDYTPSVEPQQANAGDGVDDRLEALGYR